MNKYTYCVITKLPDDVDGNLYDADDEDVYIRIFRWGKREKVQPFSKSSIIKHRKNILVSPKLKVFELGELLILNEPDGREVAGKQRAPRKWYVEYEEFDNIEDAIKRSHEVLDAEFEEWKAKNLHE